MRILKQVLRNCCSTLFSTKIKIKVKHSTAQPFRHCQPPMATFDANQRCRNPSGWMVCHSGRRRSRCAKLQKSYRIQITCQMKFCRIIDNVQILDMGLFACYRTALFSNLLYQIDHTYFIFDLLSSILATSSLKSNHCELGFFLSTNWHRSIQSW